MNKCHFAYLGRNLRFTVHFVPIVPFPIVPYVTLTVPYIVPYRSYRDLSFLLCISFPEPIVGNTVVFRRRSRYVSLLMTGIPNHRVWIRVRVGLRVNMQIKNKNNKIKKKMEEEGGETLAKQHNPPIYLHFWKDRFSGKRA